MLLYSSGSNSGKNNFSDNLSVQNQVQASNLKFDVGQTDKKDSDGDENSSLVTLRKELDKLKAENESLKKEIKKNKDQEKSESEFKPFLKTVVDMQYYTFQTINGYKQHFEDMKNEIRELKEYLNIGGSSLSTKNKDNQNNEENLSLKNIWVEERENKIKAKDVMKEEDDILSKLGKPRQKNNGKSILKTKPIESHLPRFKETRNKISKLDEDDLFFENLDKKTKEEESIIEP